MLVYTEHLTAAAFALGCAWSLVNLWILALLVGLILNDPEAHKTRIALAALVKVPALYTAGYLLLLSGVFPVAAVLAGFVWPLFIVFLKAAGRLALGLDTPGRAGVSGK
jgi:hypothetical protein